MCMSTQGELSLALGQYLTTPACWVVLCHYHKCTVGHTIQCLSDITSLRELLSVTVIIESSYHNRIGISPYHFDARVHHHRQSLFVSYHLHHFHQVLVLHLVSYQGISQQASINSQCSMQRIQASTYLHLLHLVHCLSVCEHHPCLFQCRASVRELILHHQIFALLSIYEGSHISFLSCNYRIKIVNTILLQHLQNGVVRTRSNLVYHRPGKSHLFLIINIFQKSLISKTIIAPGISIRLYRLV